MMPEDTSRFHTLRTFQHVIRDAESFDDLQAAVTNFMQEQLGSEKAVISFEPSSPSADAHNSLILPIPLTGHTLIVNREQPFNPDETAVAEMAAALLTDARPLQNPRPDPAPHVGEVNTLYQASLSMTATLDRDEVYQAVTKEMLLALKTDSCTIFVLNTTNQCLDMVAHQTIEDHGRPPTSPVGIGKIDGLENQPIIRQVLDSQEALCLRKDEEIGDAAAEMMKTAGLESALLIPLLRRKKALGVILLGQDKDPRRYEQSEIDLAKKMADQAAVAIEHADLFRQARRRIQELSTFQNIVLRLNTPLKLTEVLDTITESALKLVNASNMHIYLYNPDTRSFTFGSALWEDGRHQPAVTAPRKDGLTAAVVRHGAPIIINDASQHEFYRSPKSSSWGICAIAGFPLRHGNQVIGAFTAAFLKPHTFTDDEKLLLGLLADQAAVAVRNAGLFAGSQRRLRDMAALVDMAKQVTGNLKLKIVLQTTVQNLKSLLNARASTITMLSEDATELVVAAAAGADPKAVDKARMKLGEGVSGRVVRTADLVYIQDAHSEPDFLFFDPVVRSLLVVPLVIRDRAIGTMTVDSAKSNAFSESDIQLMTIAAAQVSVAIANARLFEELEERAGELVAAYEELKESDRLKDELVQNVSHELRTPLTFVKGYVDLLMEGEMGLVPPRQQEALQIVAEKTDEITRLIEDIITLQRIDAGNLQLERVSIAEMLRTAVASHSMVADKKGMRIASNLPVDEAKYYARIDKQRINQVLDNIINNALKFSPDGGVISVGMFEEGENVGVAISDQGIGVPDEKKERIFERFYQVDGTARRRFGGTGVGLAIVKRIIDAHNGRIWVESEVGKGSTFFITLPRAKEEIIA